MWPLLITSIIALTVVLERLFFVLSETLRRDGKLVESLFSEVKAGHLQRAIELGKSSKDYVAKVLTYALLHHEEGDANSLIRGASRELKRFNRGLTVLDTVITLAPLLGLLGTVTGMIRAFSLLGDAELGAPTAITGGIAEALIATAFGLLVAIIALIPFNFLNSKMDDARHEIEDAASRLDAMLSPQKQTQE
jgi:biopolymer transport protein ExbB